MSGRRPMRVLHFGKFATRRFGGIETHVRTLTAGLAAAGVDVVDLVYDIGRTTGGVVRERIDGVEVVGVPCRGTLASLPIAPSTPAVVSRLAREAPFDLVHAHFPDPVAYASMAAAGGAARVASWHSDIVRQRWFGALYGAAARIAGPRLDAVIGATPSHLESRQLGPFRPRVARVVPYGIDLSRFAPAGPDAARIEARAAALRADAGQRPILFALGRHVYYKGFEELIDAMARVDAVLMLAGEGPLTAALKARAAALPGPGTVRFVGRIEDADLPAWYRAARVFCFPSNERSEAFGLVQLEAMASARPIVNCALGNAVNFVAPDGVCALTVPLRDATALADAIARLLADDALRRTLGTGGRQRVEERFSERAMIDATLALYRELLGPRDGV